MDERPVTLSDPARLAAELKTQYGVDKSREFLDAISMILSESHQPSQSEENKYLEEYKILSELHIFANRAFWDKNNMFVAINLGFLAAWTLLVSGGLKPLTRNVATVMAVGAAVYCIFWFFVVGRARAYIRYWDKRTLEVEQVLKTFNTFTGFVEFAKKQRWGTISSTTIGLLIPVSLFLVWAFVIALIWLM